MTPLAKKDKALGALVVAAVVLLSAGWLVHTERNDQWPFRRAFPHAVHWCGLDWQASGTTQSTLPNPMSVPTSPPTTAVAKARVVGTTAGGGVILSPVTCAEIDHQGSPTILSVRHHGEVRTYGLVGGP